MVYRVKFSKYGITKFIGHLDVMRYFQKAIRRSGLDVSYSLGFNPHQLISFAAPLGLGQTSDGEYMDVEMNQDYSEEELMSRLSSAMSEGFEISRVTKRKEWEPNTKKESIMSLTSCADYMVSVKDTDIETEDAICAYASFFSDFHEKMSAFLSEPSILIEKEMKQKKTVMDIKPLIYAYGFEPKDINPLCEHPEEGIQNADVYENGIRVFLKLSNGSVNNLKPEVIFREFCKKYEIPYRERALQVHRMETYCDLSTRTLNQEETRKAFAAGEVKKEFVPLWQLK